MVEGMRGRARLSVVEVNAEQIYVNWGESPLQEVCDGKFENGENIWKLGELIRYFSAWLIGAYFYYTAAFPVGISCLGFGHCFMHSVDFWDL